MPTYEILVKNGDNYDTHMVIAKNTNALNAYKNKVFGELAWTRRVSGHNLIGVININRKHKPHNKELGVWSRCGDDIVKMRDNGMTLRKIGESIGVSGERVRQLLKKRDNIQKYWRSHQKTPRNPIDKT